MYKLKINKDATEKALRIYEAVKEQHQAINTEIASLPVVTIEKNGQEGIKERTALLEEYGTKKKAISEKALTQIEALRTDYNDFIKKQITPNGNELSSPDAQIILNDLIVDEAELLEIASRHGDSEVFRRLVETYAQHNGFDSAELFNITNESDLAEYGQQFFDLCSGACENPCGSYASMYLDNANAMTQLAVSHGIE